MPELAKLGPNSETAVRVAVIVPELTKAPCELNEMPFPVAATVPLFSNRFTEPN